MTSRTLYSPGIIPANTGRITKGVDKCTRRRDHPREYGENHSRMD